MTGMENLAGVLLLPLLCTASLLIASIFGLGEAVSSASPVGHPCPPVACRISFGERAKGGLCVVFTPLIAKDPSALWDRGNAGLWAFPWV